jgi:hypothetical protein
VHHEIHLRGWWSFSIGVGRVHQYAQASAANLNIHLLCLVLDGVYRTTKGVAVIRGQTKGQTTIKGSFA